MDRKQLIQLLGSIFVALIFLFSYASYGNFGTPGGKTTTTTVPPTYYATGNANATVLGYGSVMTATARCNSSIQNATVSRISNSLIALQKNGSINNYYPTTPSSFTLYAGSENTIQLYAFVNKNLNSTSILCTSFKSQTVIQLPQTVQFFVNSQKVNIQIPTALRNQTISATVLNSRSMPIRIAALLTQNGIIYGNMSITQSGGS